MKNRLEVLDLLQLTLIGPGFLRESAPFRVEQRRELFEALRRFQMPDDLLQDPDLVVGRQRRLDRRAQSNDEPLPLPDLLA